MDEKKLVIQSKKQYGETAVVSARLPVELIKKLDDISQISGRTRNDLINLCLEFAIANIEIK